MMTCDICDQPFDYVQLATFGLRVCDRCHLAGRGAIRRCVRGERGLTPDPHAIPTLSPYGDDELRLIAERDEARRDVSKLLRRLKEKETESDQSREELQKLRQRLGEAVSDRNAARDNLVRVREINRAVDERLERAGLKPGMVVTAFVDSLIDRAERADKAENELFELRARLSRMATKT